MADSDPNPALTVKGEIDLPDGGMVESSLFIVSYIDNDGASRYAWSLRGESSAASMLGIVELVKFSMQVEAMS